MAEDVSLTAQAQGAIRAEVANAIHDVLGNGDTSSSLSSAQDTINLQDVLSRKLNTLNTSIGAVATKLGDIQSSQGETARQSADAALAAEEQVTPLGRMADTLDDIYGVLKEKFKPSGLGTEDDNIGMLTQAEKEKILKEEQNKKPDTGGSAWVAGTLAAAALLSIKKYLEETWTGLAQRFLKPFVAVQLAIKGLPKSLSGLSLNFQRFTSKIGIWFSKTFPRLSKIIKTLITPIKWLTTKVKGLGRSITSAVKNFNFSKFFAPLMKWISKLSGGFGFGKLFKFLSPIGGLLKKLAFPITLVLEAFEAFKMIFVGSFTKNAQALSDSISEKGILGRAWYGFTHMFQTISTFGYEFVEMVKAWWDVFAGVFEKVKDSFHNLTDTISTMFFDMYNAVAHYIPGMKKIKTEGMKKDDAINAIKRDAGGDKNKTVGNSIDKLVMRGEKVGVAPEKGDDYISFNKRVRAAEEQTKRNEKVQLAREKQKPEYGVGRYKNQGAPVTQNNVQQTIIHEVPPWHPSRQFELGYVPVSP